MIKRAVEGRETEVVVDEVTSGAVPVELRWTGETLVTIYLGVEWYSTSVA